mmetsp:Transcript_46675/g.75078  ORF Transcript_46675/g.75078 Transcript_46675/m.75078 type:complete len:83 (-) Transcript_46675:367-615(-)
MKVFDPVMVRMAKRPTGGTTQKLKRRDAREKDTNQILNEPWRFVFNSVMTEMLRVAVSSLLLSTIDGLFKGNTHIVSTHGGG